jgi:Leucine-rich repeat (LRR) protein
MLFIYLIPIFYLIQNSFSDQCPSPNYCICSSDLTIITCINHQLTNELLLNLNTQFPQSTIVLNLSSNSLTSINSLSNLNNLQTLDLSFNKIQSLPSNLFSKFPQLSSLYLPNNSLKTIPKTFNEISNINLDISNNPFNCICQLKWLIKWFETINLFKKINCQKHDAQLTDNDFCFNKKNFLYITPEQSQIVYQNDPFVLNCSSNTKHFWSFNDQFYSSNATIFIRHLHLNHSGLWTCHSLNLNRSISLHVLNIQTNHFCQSIQMDTSKGHFYWPRTLTGQTIQFKCPFGAAAWLKNLHKRSEAYYTCSLNRQWTDLDLSQCAFRTNISREFDNLLSKNYTNLLSKLVTYLSKINLNDLKFDDIIFLIDLIDEEHEKYLYSKQNIDEISMLIYRLTDFILQTKQDLIFINEYQLALNRLRFILQKIINLTNHSWVYVGKQLTAMTLQSPLPPTMCFIPNRPLLTIVCGIVNRQFNGHEV